MKKLFSELSENVDRQLPSITLTPATNTSIIADLPNAAVAKQFGKKNKAVCTCSYYLGSLMFLVVFA